MAGIGCEGGIKLTARPIRRRHVQRNRRLHVACLRCINPGKNTRMVFTQVTCLPLQMKQVAAEIHRMLSGAAADLEHVARLLQHPAKHCENRIAVALAGFRKRLVHWIFDGSAR